MHRTGLMNYYYLDAGKSAWEPLAGLFNRAYLMNTEAAKEDYLIKCMDLGAD